MTKINFPRYVICLFTIFWVNTQSLADFNRGTEAFKKSDYSTAFKEFLVSANNDDADTQFNLGYMYENGLLLSLGILTFPTQAHLLHVTNYKHKSFGLQTSVSNHIRRE